jgi:hypothetical protein
MRVSLRFILIILVTSLWGCGDHSGTERAALSEIESRAQQGARETELISLVQKNPSAFSVSGDDVIRLKHNGIADAVVVEMLWHRR